jgi:uncharacterized protein YaiE (UPF0345 family)
MASDSKELVFEMAQGRSLRLADAHPHLVFCLSGSLGLTRNDDPNAVVLSAGDSYQCDGKSTVMLRALADSRVRMVSPASSASREHPPGRVSTLSALLARLRR